MSLVLLVRHAESHNNELLERLRAEKPRAAADAEYDSTKKADPELSALGEQQAARCAEWLPRYLASMDFLAEERRVVLVASPMNRTLCTTIPIARELGLRAEIWGDCHETKGCWSGGMPPQRGRTPTEILEVVGTAHFRNSEVAPVPESGWWSAPDGAPKGRESHEDSCARAHRVAARLRRQALGASQHTITILVTHGNWMSLLLQALLDPDVTDPQLMPQRKFKHDNTAVTAIVLPGVEGDTVAQLVQTNRSEHLDASPPIRRTRQGVRLSGFDKTGQRNPGWQVGVQGGVGLVGRVGWGLGVVAGVVVLGSWLRKPDR